MAKLFSKSTGGFYERDLHGDSMPADVIEITDEEYLGLLVGQAAGKRIVAGASGRPTLAAPPPPTPEQIIASMSAAVQSHLDAKAKERNYDGILSLCTYATSLNPKVAAEGQAGVEWRDAVWAKCYEILAGVQAGTRPAPTAEQLIGALPIFAWPA